MTERAPQALSDVNEIHTTKKGRRVHDFTDRELTEADVRSIFYKRPKYRTIKHNSPLVIKHDPPPTERHRPSEPRVSQPQTSEPRGNQPRTSEPSWHPSDFQDEREGIALQIEFALNSSEILPQFEPKLNVIGNTLSEDPNLQIEVTGHADSTGPFAHNQRLSEHRAEAVKQYLVQLFLISPNRILASGQGETNPLYRPSTNPKNRRVDFFSR